MFYLVYDEYDDWQETFNNIEDANDYIKEIADKGFDVSDWYIITE